MNQSNTDSERKIYILSLIFLGWAFINFKPQESSGLFFLLILSIVVFLFDTLFFNKKITIPFSKGKSNWGQAIAVGVVAGLIFTFISSFILSVDFRTAIKLFRGAALPSFAGSNILIIFVWGFLIPFIESVVAIRLYEYFTDRLNSNLLEFNFINISIASLIGVGALLFHATVFGITNNRALLITFLFFTTGVLLSMKYGEIKQFVIEHVTVNTLAFIYRT